MADDYKKTKNHLLITSCLISFLILGEGAIGATLKVLTMSVKVTDPNLIWLSLLLYWMYCSYRFSIMSNTGVRSEIARVFSEWFSKENIVYKIFPTAKYFSGSDVDWLTRPWPESACIDISGQGEKFCNYIRYPLGRALEFSYFQKSVGYEHFLDKRKGYSNNIRSGNVGIRDLAYYKCLWYELKCVVDKVGSSPTIFDYFITIWLSKLTLLLVVYKFSMMVFK